MHKITFSSGSTALTDTVNYIRLHKNGCYVLCEKHEAQGIAYKSTPYSIGGIDGLELVTVEEVDGGAEVDALKAETATVKQSVETVQNQTAEASAMNAQMQTAAALFVQSATSIPDAVALKMPDLFKTWEQALADGSQLAANTIINDNGQLYRVVQAVTPQSHQAPHSEGMLAIYRPIDTEHAGTQDDPIPYVNGMDTEKDKYYSYNGKTYLCNLTMTPCVWAPDTPGLWQWKEVTA